MSARETLESWVRQGRTTVHEADAKALLAEIGIPMPERNPSDGLVVVKLCHDDYPHKSDHGLVRLGLLPDEATAAAKEMSDRIAGGEPLVEAMETESLVEWIVGCKNDDTFGPIVLAGPGGVLVELLDAGEIRLAPANMETAKGMLSIGSGGKILNGMRGNEPADRGALGELISLLSAFYSENADIISEIEINPVMVRADGAGLVAADALIILHGPVQNEKENK